jgi:hypothetical protein
MDTFAFLKLSLEQSKNWFFALTSDMKDAPLTAPTPNGGNHPLWVLGHIVYSEAGLVYGMIQGEQNPLAKWKSLFGGGSEPVADASRYPSWDELIAEFEKVRAHTLKTLASFSEKDLERRSHAPAERAMMFGTIGQVLFMVTHHMMFHAGQIADARRAAGRGPLFA